MLTVAVLSVLPGVPVSAAEGPEPPEYRFLGEARVEIGTGGLALVPVAVTARGPLFALAPLVARLGGELESGASGGYRLLFGETEYLFGPDSAALVVKQEIAPLSQPPALISGSLHVPLDLLEEAYGDAMGYGFAWDGTSRLLSIDRQRAREVTLAVDAVHIRGATTLVLQFGSRPRYRIVERPQRIEVEMIGDRLLPPPVLPRLEEGLVSSVRVAPERVTIELARGAEASSYELEDPFRLVFDVLRQARPVPAVPGDPAPPSPLPRRRIDVETIVIDPGHGGAESGAVGKSGVEEKDLTLTLGRALARRLRQRLPAEVILTRDEDVSLPLDSRAALANENRGDLFISIHLNSSLGASATGAETYFLSMQASDPRAAESAATENRGVGGDGGDLDRDLQLILWDLAQSRFLSQSQELARLIQEELNGALGLRDRGVRQAPFRVLMGLEMPAVLIELGFLSNPEEEEKLQDPAYRDQLVEAVARAVERYRTLQLGPAGNAAARPEAAAGGPPGGEPATPPRERR